MAGQLDTAQNFIDGNIVNAATLNDIIDTAFGNPELVHSQTLVTTLVPANDEVLVWDASAGGGSGGLGRAKVEKLPSGTTSIDWDAGNPAPTTIFSGNVTPTTGAAKITLGLKNQGPNKFLLGPTTGAATTPTFRVATPADLTLPVVAMTDYIVDWSLGNVFDLWWPDNNNRTMEFLNIRAGQTIKVRIRQTVGGAHVSWPTVIWNEGAEPDMTTAPNGYGIYVFTAVSHTGVTVVHGYLESATGYVTGVTATATPVGVFDISVTNPTTAPAIALSMDKQVANTFMSGPVSGADATPSFRALSPADLPAATVTVSTTTIDWSLGNCFAKTLPASGVVSMGFSNPIEGQTITVLMGQLGTATVSWPGSVLWAGGTPHPMTSGAGAHDILVFRYIGAHYYGNYLLNFV